MFSLAPVWKVKLKCQQSDVMHSNPSCPSPKISSALVFSSALVLSVETAAVCDIWPTWFDLKPVRALSVPLILFYIHNNSDKQAFQPSQCEHIADFSPLSSSAIAPCATVSEMWTEGASVQCAKKRSSPQKFPGVLYRKLIWRKNYRFTSRWRQWGERLHSPWCPLTQVTDQNGSAGHVQHSRSAPALRHTWWHRNSGCSGKV